MNHAQEIANGDYIPSDEERKQILDHLIPVIIRETDDDIEEQSLEYRGLTLVEIHSKLRAVYELMFEFESSQTKKRLFPPGFSDEENWRFMTELNGLCFGTCPTCGYWGSYWKVSEEHWLVCESHRLKWNISWADKEVPTTQGSPTTIFRPWERLSAISQCLRNIEPLDISAYREVAQLVTPKEFQDMTETAVDLREMYHQQRMLEWLRSETGLIGGCDAERQHQFATFAETSTSLLNELLANYPRSSEE